MKAMISLMVAKWVLALSMAVVVSIPLGGALRKVKITVLYNNLPYDGRLETGWGFSAYIEGASRRILFDTGGDGKMLLRNMEKIGISPSMIDVVVLSHIHGDHTGGLWSLLEKRKGLVVYLPRSFPSDFKARVKELGSEYVEVEGPVEICPGVFTTGELSRGIVEQSLIVILPQKLVVITGCAHPGVVNIVREARKLLGKKKVTLVGGFHLWGYPGEEIRHLINELKLLEVVEIAPSHCTGELAIELMREAWGKRFLPGGCGARIEIH